MKDTLSMVIYNRDAEVEEGKRRLVGFEFFYIFLEGKLFLRGSFFIKWA